MALFFTKLRYMLQFSPKNFGIIAPNVIPLRYQSINRGQSYDKNGNLPSKSFKNSRSRLDCNKRMLIRVFAGLHQEGCSRFESWHDRH